MNVVNSAQSDPHSDPLTDLAPEELTDCARLLALSIAHHRAKFGVVPLTASNAENLKHPATNAAVALRHAAGIAIKEAVELVCIQRDSTAEGKEANPEAGTYDKRRQMRISVSAAVRITDLAGKHSSNATLRNISWGGAALRCSELDASPGDRICVLLPAAGKQPIRIESTVLRESNHDNEREYGLRFDSLDPDDEERLLEVLSLLMKSPDPDPRRSEVRLVQRLEVEYGDAGEFRAVLEDISTRGMMLTVPEPIEIGESLLISLSSVDTPFGLNLRARVVHQALVENCDIDMYRVGLEFEHPSQRLHDRISAVMHELALIGLRESLNADEQANEDVDDQ